MDFEICIERVCRCLEGEYTGIFRSRRDRIYDSRRILVELKRVE